MKKSGSIKWQPCIYLQEDVFNVVNKCQFISPPATPEGSVELISAATVSRNPHNIKLNQKIISIKGRSTSHTVWLIVEVRWCLRLRLFQGGRLIAGRDNEPFRGQLHIKLRGNHSTPDWPLPNGPNQGSKVLGEKTASDSPELYFPHMEISNIVTIYLQHIVHYLTLELKETWINPYIITSSANISAWIT